MFHADRGFGDIIYVSVKVIAETKNPEGEAESDYSSLKAKHDHPCFYLRREAVLPFHFVSINRHM